MTDLETRLSEALRGAAEVAPQGRGLAEGARARLRRRRRTTLAAVAAVLLVVAVPLGLRLVAPGGGPQVANVAPDGWRTETYGDLTLKVPPSWGYEGGTDWCAESPIAEQATPAVERPGGLTRDILCTPHRGYGVTFVGPGERLALGPSSVPRAAFVQRIEVARTHAWVVTRTQEEMDQIVASAEQVRDVDPNGCPPRQTSEIAPTERISVCRYENLRLVQSERLDAEDSRSAASALRAAPEVDRGGDMCGDTPVPTIRMVGAGVVGVVVPQCGRATAGDMTSRRITPDIMFWALSPGWQGTLPDSAPLPDPLRD
jgi:hypothetical protein